MTEVPLGVESDPRTWTDNSGPGQLKLQRPSVLYCRGAIRPWEEGVIHVASEAALRGLNVFEGLKGYHQADGGFAFVSLHRHYERFLRSASLLHIPVPVDYPEFLRVCWELTDALLESDKDLYLRATLLVTEGHYGQGTVADLVVTGYQQEQVPPEPVPVGVSTWRRAADVMMPARIKTGTNYFVARLARMEGQGRAFEEMILLNANGRVAEFTGACLVMVREGRVITPPTWEGSLESITLEAVEGICRTEDIAFEQRPIDRSELGVAEEVGLVGTLCEITPVQSLDGQAIGVSRVLSSVSHAYRAAVRGEAPHPSVVMDQRPAQSSDAS